MLFLSPQFPRQKVVLQSARHNFDSMGNRQFFPGKSIQFVDGQYETANPEEIELIKKLDSYGTEIFTSEGQTDPSADAIKRLNIERNAVPQALSCPNCSFKAKTGLGLSSHLRKHERESAAEARGEEVTEADMQPPQGE